MAKSKRRAPKRGWFGRISSWLVSAVLIFLLGSVLWVLLYRFVPPPITFTMAGDLLGGRSISKDWMPIEEIDDDMERAAIAAEDSKFCSHRGFDVDAIAQAMRENAQGGRIRGGSTISQQTAKNAFLWQGGGYVRKGLEAWFTLLIENLWPKQRIMEVYLNIAETGLGTYGVNAGAQRYFDKDASSLSRTEAARIAAVLPLPKEREAIAPSGFTRRYGNSIAARIRVVQRDGLDACLKGDGVRMAVEEPEEAPAAPTQRKQAAPAAAPDPQPERIEDYLEAPDIGPPVAAQSPAEGVPPVIEIEPPPPPPAAEPSDANGM
ncbi:monofunctional biosynthetic peptidoglycan transglycosylase [Enterovirga sp. GCM10030262]|uniref:monofunctional biosynthetic peptidoglycan transglycosylase n=1 Tax=Enterovirga sp. GCM10030262 TaxID=3273391 RepID=UPI0036211E0E